MTADTLLRLRKAAQFRTDCDSLQAGHMENISRTFRLVTLFLYEQATLLFIGNNRGVSFSKYFNTKQWLRPSTYSISVHHHGAAGTIGSTG